ncbi:hypothetical protein AN958_01499 [Leucoagaricus sp. SymC.cos]|nr:hypothetical protein AN958_01499 [Leucoagaricus sp. SymC.cos]
MPPVVQVPAPLFHKVYIDTMHMPPSHGYKYIVQARDSLTGWIEWRALTQETGRTLGQFIFEEILSYNSQSNGVVETTHRTIHNGLVKMCMGYIKSWYKYTPYIFWANCVTTRKSTGMTPYYAVHGVEPLHPFDITKATFLASSITHHLSDSELLAVCAQMLQKHDEDLVQIHDKVLATRYASICKFEKKNANHIHDYDFGPGELVFVLNKKIKPDVGHKCKPRYFGPMVVVKWLCSGAYILAEVNRAISCLKFAAFRIIPYHPQSRKRLEITKFVDLKDLGGVEDDDVAGSGAVDEGN